MINENSELVLSVPLFLEFFDLDEKYIESVSFKSVNSDILINVLMKRRLHTCPDCRNKTDKIKGYYTRTIKHQFLSNKNCLIKYKARRYVCPTCSKTFYEENPFMFKDTKLSPTTVFNVLGDLKSSKETFSGVANRYFISATTAQAIFDRHVKIPRYKLPKVLLIDEVYAKKGQYACVMVDYFTKDIIEVLPSRRKDFLINYILNIPIEERKSVKYLCCDMWDTYRVIAYSYLPNCKVIVDKFHVIQELSRRCMKVRSKILAKYRPNKLKPIDEMTKEERLNYEQNEINYYLLKKFQWLLFTSKVQDPNGPRRYNKKLKRYLNYYEIYELLLEIDDDIVQINNIVFYLNNFYKSSNINNAEDELNNLIKRVKECKIFEISEFSKTLQKWKIEIINSFTIVEKKTIKYKDKSTKATFTKEIDIKITNGLIENRNKIIKDIKRNSNGYTNWDRFRNRVMYVANPEATYSIFPDTDVVNWQKEQRRKRKKIEDSK